MDNLEIADKIKNQMEALILEAILAVLDKLTQQVATIKKNTENQILNYEKF